MERAGQYWERGRPRPPERRSTLNLKLRDAVTVSRFALIAGEGARAPSISLSLSAIPLFGQGPLTICSVFTDYRTLPDYLMSFVSPCFESKRCVVDSVILEGRLA